MMPTTFIAADLSPELVFVGSMVFVLLCVILSMIKSLIRNHSLQRTIREIAAYTAEGSIAPDEAQKMIDAASKGAKRCC